MCSILFSTFFHHKNATQFSLKLKHLMIIFHSQARTDAEREESDDEEVEEEMEEEPEDDIPYNPKNLPLGWDGKPIPYWLYKLHGLNISYNCEICGNYTYKVNIEFRLKIGNNFVFSDDLYTWPRSSENLYRKLI